MEETNEQSRTNQEEEKSMEETKEVVTEVTNQGLISRYSGMMVNVDKETAEVLLREFLEEVKSSSRRSTGDPIKRLREMSRIEDVRKAIKVIHAKKSKARDNAATLARYDEELKEAQKRLNELLDGAEEDPYTLLTKGAEMSRVAQAWVIREESRLKDRLGEIGALTDNDNLKGRVKTMLKAFDNSEMDSEMESDLKELNPRVLEIVKERFKHDDKRVQNVVRTYNFIHSNPVIDQVQ